MISNADRRAKARSVSRRARVKGYRLWFRFRFDNLRQDLVALWAGYCNDSPFRPDPGGGYEFWRCCRKAGHDGLHRFRNYEWGEDKTPGYTLAEGYVDQPESRHPGLTRRQRRAVDEWHRSREARP